MRWLVGIAITALGAWVKSIADREYVRGYKSAIEDIERNQKIVERHTREALR